MRLGVTTDVGGDVDGGQGGREALTGKMCCGEEQRKMGWEQAEGQYTHALGRCLRRSPFTYSPNIPLISWPSCAQHVRRKAAT